MGACNCEVIEYGLNSRNLHCHCKTAVNLEFFRIGVVKTLPVWYSCTDQVGHTWVAASLDMVCRVLGMWRKETVL